MSGERHIIDLTRTIEHQQPGVKIHSAKSLKNDGWNASTLELYSHSGTHMDAPWHFEVNALTIDKIPLDRLMGRALVLDISHVGEHHLIRPDDFKNQLENVKKGDNILLKSGWSQWFGTSKYRDNLPRISKELALWFGEKQINILGVEPPSVADVNNLEEVKEIHQILMENNIIIIEGLVNLNKLKKTEIMLMAFPLKIKDGDGSPARVLAIEDR
ncbi:cyclase family protein [Ulvibacterium marinum]|uniref:Cyclase family protein n=1 Tax=Ulvibacterium marinum TaxID=2419782 RepID=A0A3B0CER4_9FLAO|nr:cyclase family protein [Ulvibacterium marinum]RKN82489.1 cyclase family protein [Ulvibacterium marinum]